MNRHEHQITRARNDRGRDRGAAPTVAIVLMTPVLVFVCCAAFQAALWNHARAETRAIARSAAASVARGVTSPGDARADAIANLTANTDLTNITATITTNNGHVVVTVTGRAPGVLVGTRAPITVTVALPTEGWTPL